jgi:hypothetical protein
VVAALTAAAAAAAGLLSGTAATAEPKSSLAQVRQATSAFHVVARAEDAGYHEFLPCFDNPGTGGMGQHFANPGLIDGTVEPTRPEVLVYEPKDGRYQLVAVEYVVPQGAPYSDADPPTLFGEAFHRNDTLGIWAFHAWVWRGNPTGVHEDWNPNVRLCPPT